MAIESRTGTNSLYSYGIAYYITQGQTRVPRTGLTVKLVRPQAGFSSVLLMQETAPGYYEVTVASESLCGFYEIWDNTVHPQGSHSGKHAILGRLDMNGIQYASNFLLQLAELQNQINEMPQIYGADIYVQDHEPDTLSDYVWIDTRGVNFIS